MPFPPTDAAALYSDHHGWLQRWLKFRLNNAYDAADLAHDTFVRVLARPRGIEGGEGGQRAYLTTIARGLLCLLYTSPSPRDQRGSRMPSSA